MVCENLVSTQVEELDLSVTVRVTNLDRPLSEEQLRDELLAHALDCHECLQVVLFTRDSLADSGCETYRRMFEAATEQLASSQSIDPAQHLTYELVEAFFLDKLSDTQMTAMADHVEGCADCQHMLQARQSFYLCVKAAVQEHRESPASLSRLQGVLGVSSPEKGLHFCSRINE